MECVTLYYDALHCKSIELCNKIHFQNQHKSFERSCIDTCYHSFDNNFEVKHLTGFVICIHQL